MVVEKLRNSSPCRQSVITVPSGCLTSAGFGKAGHAHSDVAPSNISKQIESNLFIYVNLLCRKLGSFGKGNENRAKYKEKCIFSLSKTCISPVFFVSLHLEKAVAASCKPTPNALRFKSFGGRRKIFARSPQDIAPPAARLCHGRGKLVTCRFAPCYMPS